MLDLLFILDGSSSSTHQEFKLIKTFVKSFIDLLDIGDTSTRVSLIEYSNRATLEFSLNSYYDEGKLKDAIDDVQASGGSGTATDQAFQIAINQVFTRKGGDRPGIPNAVFLVTDGKSTGRLPLVNVVKPLKKSGTSVYVIGVGPATDPSELRSLTSGDNMVYIVKNVYEMIKLLSPIVKAVFDNTQQSKLVVFISIPVWNPVLSLSAVT